MDSDLKSIPIRKNFQGTNEPNFGLSFIEQKSRMNDVIPRYSLIKPIVDHALEYELAIRSHLRSESYSADSNKSVVIPLTKAKIHNIMPEVKTDTVNTAWDTHLLKLEKQESQLKKLIKNLDRKKKIISQNSSPLPNKSPAIIKMPRPNELLSHSRHGNHLPQRAVPLLRKKLNQR